MNVVDVLVTIIVVTILVTIVLGVVTYIAYKLRLARRPSPAVGEEASPRYFDLHAPPGEEGAGRGAAAREAEAGRGG